MTDTFTIAPAIAPAVAPALVPASPASAQQRAPNGQYTTTPETLPATPAAEAGIPAPDGTPALDAVPAETDEQLREKEQRKTSAQSRINQITAQKHDAITRAERAEKREAELVKQLRALQQADPNDPTTDMRRAVKVESYEQNRTELAEAREIAGEARQAEFNAKVSAARDTIPDLDQSVAMFLSLPLSQAAADTIAASDKAAEIAHYFGKNPQEAYRLAGLPVHMQAFEIGQIAAKMAVPVVNRISQAPRPVQPLSGTSAPMAFDPEKSSMDEYAARWNAEHKASMAR